MLFAGICLGMVIGWLVPPYKKNKKSNRTVSSMVIKVEIDDSQAKKKLKELAADIEGLSCPHCGTYCHGKSVFCTPPLNTAIPIDVTKLSSNAPEFITPLNCVASKPVHGD